MQTLITATHKIFNVLWCGLSTLDYVLRFEVVGSTMQEVLATFTNPEETATLIHRFDEGEIVFRGYTLFVGVDMRQNNKIVVSLMEG